ncbi:MULTISPECIES: histidine phosphatase family protein [Paenibacillus]|uniref:histidine phosphatase family protein n=1 Tax=Paenibacillus TaxID=44249 RepID=UPI002041AD7B|nr:histidine phosphatase family protein [Paenibacillus camelliae]MCM3633052.1 histidine phosphatase family protein [Paenibacillus camelliae]
MQIGLIRHGETSWNAVKRIQGQTDIPLNENGIKQAKLLAQRLQGEREDQHWDYLITSDLQRAMATGQHIAEALQIPMLSPDSRLRERYFGQIEGTTLEERVERWGEGWKELDLGAETDEAMRSRGLTLLNELYASYPEQNILCVTHGSFIAELLLELFPTIEDKRINNLSYSILKRDSESWQLMLHNCTKHLELDTCV